MEELKIKHEKLLSALETFERSLRNFEEIKKKGEETLSFMGHDEVVESLRDSMIQRFEISVDLFWKYIKKYLDEIVKVAPSVVGPAPVIRAACNANLIEASDAENAMEMIKKRNMTSHIYKEEIADRISVEIPGYYELMKKYADKLAP